MSSRNKILTLLTQFFMKAEFDFESIKNKTIEQLKASKPLLGKDGAFAPLLESILNAALEGEMEPILQMKNVSWAIVVMVKCRSKSRLHWVKSQCLPLVTVIQVLSLSL